MFHYSGEPDFQHGEIPAVGVLISNLGTPDEPTTPAVRRYLREFLSDPRVIELPTALRWLILNLFVLPRRPRASAALYRKVWSAEGSPLLAIARRQRAAIEDGLRRLVGSPIHVALGMRYGHPAVREALAELRDRGCRRILVLPLYPQYSAVTTASTFDAVAAELTGWRWLPELRTVNQYHDDARYVAALAASVREVWNEGGEANRLLFSFHGIPQRYYDGGDPYPCQCRKTARLVAEALALAADRWEVSFQSLFGREEWVKPYTANTVQAMARAGVTTLDVIAPGFSADCLETVDELDVLNRELFLGAGGRRFRYIPALNARPDHMRMLTELVWRNLTGWVSAPDEWDAQTAVTEAAASRLRAEERIARPAVADGGYQPIGVTDRGDSGSA